MQSNVASNWKGNESFIDFSSCLLALLGTMQQVGATISLWCVEKAKFIIHPTVRHEASEVLP